MSEIELHITTLRHFLIADILCTYSKLYYTSNIKQLNNFTAILIGKDDKEFVMIEKYDL